MDVGSNPVADQTRSARELGYLPSLARRPRADASDILRRIPTDSGGADDAGAGAHRGGQERGPRLEELPELREVLHYRGALGRLFRSAAEVSEWAMLAGFVPRTSMMSVPSPTPPVGTPRRRPRTDGICFRALASPATYALDGPPGDERIRSDSP